MSEKRPAGPGAEDDVSDYGSAIGKVMGLLGDMSEWERALAVRAIVAAFPVAKSERRIEAGRANGTKRSVPSSLPPPLPGNYLAVTQELPLQLLGNAEGNAGVITSPLPVGGEGGDSRIFDSLPDLLSSQRISPPSPLLPEETVTGSTATRARALNPAALVDAFVDGVNGAASSPTWAAPKGRQFTDLADGLQLHAADEARKSPIATPLALCKRLGARWSAFCALAPRDAWKAAAWLGEGAPPPREVPKPPREANAPRKCAECKVPTTAGKLCTDCRRRSAEAADREESYGREKDRRSGPPPPDVQERLNGLLKPLPASGKIRKADEQIAELEALQRAEGGQ